MGIYREQIQGCCLVPRDLPTKRKCVMKPSQKDIQITMIACLKSVIQSGAPKQQWEDLTKHAFKVWLEMSKKAVEKLCN